MPVNQPHPLHLARQDDWQQMSDTHQGERTVKERGETYLPPTEGMVLDGMGDGQVGRQAYDAYKTRAVFHDFVKQAVEAMVGIMHREAARIEVPEKMKPLLDKITVNGESAQVLLRRMNEWQLLYGRCGLLVEAPTGATVADAKPYLALYSAPAILNWDDGVRAQGKQELEFVTLNESGYERQADFQWVFRNRYRVIAMSDVVATFTAGADTQAAQVADGVYQVVALPADQQDIPPDASWITPQIGGKSLDKIPFIFVGTKDLAPDPDDPPLLGLSNLSLAVYRGEADYRQALYMQGQETFVTIGADTEKKDRLGAGARLDLPRDADAKFVGVSAEGLSAQRTSIMDDKMAAGEQTSRLFDSSGTSYQSGTALRIRISAKTATLRSIAETGAEALKQALQIMAEWMGEDPSKIVVEPNTDFAEVEAASRTLLELVQAKNLGAPISLQSLHRFMVRQDLSVLSFEEEKGQMDEEGPFVPPASGQPGLSGQAGGAAGASTGGSRVRRGVEKPAPAAAAKE
jgi:hypothetical protein